MVHQNLKIDFAGLVDKLIHVVKYPVSLKDICTCYVLQSFVSSKYHTEVDILQWFKFITGGGGGGGGWVRQRCLVAFVTGASN